MKYKALLEEGDSNSIDVVEIVSNNVKEVGYELFHGFSKS